MVKDPLFLWSNALYITHIRTYCALRDYLKSVFLSFHLEHFNWCFCFLYKFWVNFNVKNYKINIGRVGIKLRSGGWKIFLKNGGKLLFGTLRVCKNVSVCLTLPNCCIKEEAIGKRVNSGAGYGLEIPVRHHFFDHVKAIYWLKKKLETVEKELECNVSKCPK